MLHNFPLAMFVPIGGLDVPFSYLPDGSTQYRSITLTTSATHSGDIWIKRAKLGAVQPVIDGHIYFNASNHLVINGLTTSAVFRDVGSFYNISWNASGAEVNGVTLTGSGTYATSSMTNPRIGYDGTNFADMYFADNFAFWDGSSQALGSGGESDSAGVWRPKSVTGDYGWSDWADVGGTITQVIDTPGMGDDQNYSHWNPLKITSGGPTFSNGNRTATQTVTGEDVYTTIPIPANALTYAEMTFSGGNVHLGVVDVAGALGGLSESRGWWSLDGRKLSNGTLTAYASAPSGVVGIAMDTVNGAIYFRDSTGFVNGGDPESGASKTGAAFTDINTAATEWWFSAYLGTGATVTINTGQTAFSYTPPVGYGNNQTASLPQPATAASVTPLSGSVTGDGTSDKFVYLGYAPDTAASSTFDGSPLVWGTHALPLANGVLFLAPSAAAHPYSIAVKYPFGGGTTTPAPAQFD